LEVVYALFGKDLQKDMKYYSWSFIAIRSNLFTIKITYRFTFFQENNSESMVHSTCNTTWLQFKLYYCRSHCV